MIDSCDIYFVLIKTSSFTFFFYWGEIATVVQIKCCKSLVVDLQMQMQCKYDVANYWGWICIRDDIHKKLIILNGHCPLSSDPPPPRLNGQGGPFSGRQERHFSAYYGINFKLILIMKMMISVMKIVIILMIMVMKMTKNRQIPWPFSQITW